MNDSFFSTIRTALQTRKAMDNRLGIERLWLLITDLTPEIMGQQIVPMLELVDIVRWDSAVVGPSARNALQNILHASLPIPMGRTESDTPCQIERNYATLNWLFKRGVRIRDFEISRLESASLSLLKSHISLLGSGIRLKCFTPRQGIETAQDWAEYSSFLQKLDGLHCRADSPADLLLELASHATNLSALTVSSYYYGMTATEGDCLRVMTIVMNNSQTLRSLTVANGMHPLNALPPHVAFHTLRELVIRGVHCTSLSLCNLALRCTTLRTLVLDAQSKRRDEHLVDEGIAAIALSNSNLTFVDLRNINISHVALEELVAHCRELRHLFFNNADAKLQDLHCFDQHGVQLQSLGFACDFRQGTAPVFFQDLRQLIVFTGSLSTTLTGIAAALRCAPNLRILDYGGWPYLDSATILAIAGSCTALVDLALEVADTVTETDLCILVTRLHGLTTLTLCSEAASTDTLLQTIGGHCPRLQHLQLQLYLGKVTDHGVVALAQGCVNLRHLDLSHTSGVTDVGVDALALHCVRLQYLHLSSGKKWSDEVVVRLVQRCRKLRKLRISNLSVSAACLEQLHRDYPRCTVVLPGRSCRVLPPTLVRVQRVRLFPLA